MIRAIADKVVAYGITRLCHFTQARFLPSIVQVGAVLPAGGLEDAGITRQVNDPLRLDGHPECISCSIEYPNAWFLRRARFNEQLYRDWLVLLIRPDPLWRDDTLYCPCNAATQSGGLIEHGEAGFDAMYAPKVVGARRTFARSPSHLACCPTDNQAEVLVCGSIPTSDLLGIAVRTPEQAHLEYTRLKMIRLQAPAPLVVAPHLFDPYVLKAAISNGIRPPETIWHPEDVS